VSERWTEEEMLNLRIYLTIVGVVLTLTGILGGVIAAVLGGCGQG